MSIKNFAYALVLYKIVNYRKFLFLFFNQKVKLCLFWMYSLTSSGKKLIEEKKTKSINDIKKIIFSKNWDNKFDILPENSYDSNKIINIINKRESTLNKRISGGIYLEDEKCKKLMKLACSKYLLSNPLHPDLFPELTRMEAEIIKMIGGLFKLPDNGSGTLTTGGTESTILALKAYRDYFKKNNYYIGRPEILTTNTVHAAVNKAAELLEMNIKYCDLDENYKIDVLKLKSYISRNTCVIVLSTPCFSYGIVDPVKDVCEIAKKNNIPVHVDACLGGFIVPFTKHKIDFSMNISSISIDPHKFGYAPKGSSVLLWRSKVIKKHQYFVVDDWNGGIYATPSLPGSRSGMAIVGTWSSLLYHGYTKYKNIAEDIVDKTIYLKNKINKIDGMYVIGEPDINVVAFNSDKYPIGEIHNRLSEKKWNLNLLQNPLAIHICITPVNINQIDNLIIDIKEVISKEFTNKSEGIAAIYGMASAIPDKSIIKDIVHEYLHLTTELY